MCDDKKRDVNNPKKSDYLELETVAASTDLTGLVQKPPSDESEAESYNELHNVVVADDVPERV